MCRDKIVGMEALHDLISQTLYQQVAESIYTEIIEVIKDIFSFLLDAHIQRHFLLLLSSLYTSAICKKLVINYLFQSVVLSAEFLFVTHTMAAGDGCILFK